MPSSLSHETHKTRPIRESNAKFGARQNATHLLICRQFLRASLRHSLSGQLHMIDTGIRGQYVSDLQEKFVRANKLAASRIAIIA